MRGGRPAAALAGAVALAGIVLALWRSEGTGRAADSPPPAAPSAVGVPVAAVVEQTVPVYLEYVGSTDAISTVALQAQVTGYLLRQVARDGADVAKGDLLYQIDPRTYQATLDQAQAQAQKDAAALEYAKNNHSRNAVMSKTGDVSIDTLQQSHSSEMQDAAALAADRAAIETAQINLAYTQIRAPFSGRLSRTQAYEGALINTAGTQLNTLVQLDPIYATFNPPDADLPQIEKYQAQSPIPAEIVVGSGNATALYSGKVTFLDNSVSRGTGTITARATVDNPQHTLLPGQFIRVRLHVTDEPKTLLVPQVAVGSSQLGSYVYVVGPDNKLAQNFVTLGADYGQLVAVTKGVAKGQSVVVGNLLKIGPGTLVKPEPAESSEKTAEASGTSPASGSR
jgi:membrane fusion protein, multidrug efflux system